jgi:16S rRNA (uracil1498-N3)-methyltransferase
VARRIHVQRIQTGENLLDASQAHHVRDVLRLRIGATVELFDDAGNVGQAIVTGVGAAGVAVRVEEIEQAETTENLVIASAVPKGDRADWMIEKLSELGVSRFIPLQTARSVVHPTGTGKRDRWTRIATESAKQSHRSGVLKIDDLTPIEALLAEFPDALVCSTEEATPLAEASLQSDRAVVFIGPEGGWTHEEIAMFATHNLTSVKLTATILRVETAAIAAAAIAATLLARH